jgi:hypothetical protein
MLAVLVIALQAQIDMESICYNDCPGNNRDKVCDDGGCKAGQFCDARNLCPFGHDCADCGPRYATVRPTASESTNHSSLRLIPFFPIAAPTTSPTFVTIQQAAPRVKVTVAFSGLVKDQVLGDAKAQTALRQV